MKDSEFSPCRGEFQEFSAAAIFRGDAVKSSESIPPAGEGTGAADCSMNQNRADILKELYGNTDIISVSIV